MIMRRVFAFILGALLLVHGGANAQQKVVHRNIGIDSLITLMQRNCNEKIYCQKGDDAGKLVWECPVCGNRDQSRMSVARRTCGYIGTQFWNQGRTQEIKDRVLHL